MNTNAGTTRRGLLAAGGVALAAATTSKVGGALAAAGVETDGDERTEIVTFSAFGSGDALRFLRYDGSEIELVDPLPSGIVWEEGHEAIIIENFVDENWELTDIQRLYREIVPQEVESRNGSLIVGTEDELIVEDETEATAGEGFEEKLPISGIDSESTVGGMGYRDPSGQRIVAALLASR